MNEQLLELMGRFKTIIHDDLSLEMKQYAQEFDVPIIQDQGLELMLQLLRIKQPQSILEIGTAIGYSSLMMARHLPKTHIVSIERDPKRYNEAIAYHERSSIKEQVTLLEADALEIANEELPIQKYDVIFIDAAKAQYQKFFEKYEPLLKEDGMIISDNLIFHGHIFDNNQKQSRNLKQLVRKINRYNDWLANHPNYDTLLLPIGDGVAISLKKKVK
ncbi:Putative O-methyltransferase MSMEG_5073 [Turicibacter sanguinis]|uniref:O-methyltransferase n=1 Tax=Turicibacter bilis TaxID=2735723 RepID=UPI0006C0E487|nr:O-methyltransferase [Turicibacter sp.]MDD5983976.1 O-methyltransferase [Turicibacter sp.]CUO04474.1 Putative O-methyltransferase MSMEG_5073 [Turicibacter sanguinis]